MSHLATWTQNTFINHEPNEDTPHPAHYLKVEKLIDGTWVNTAWAPHIKAVEQHAKAIGGKVRALDMTDNVIGNEVFFIDIGSDVCDNVCPEHN